MNKSTITMPYIEFEKLNQDAKHFREILKGKKSVYYQSYYNPVFFYDLTEEESAKKMAEVINDRDIEINKLKDEIKKLKEKKSLFGINK